MYDVEELLQQLEQTEVAPPGRPFEDELWAELEQHLQDRPWWQALVPSQGFGRTVLAGVALAGVIAALVGAAVWLTTRDDRPPPVIDQVELDPLPESLVGDALPPFRATVHVVPSIDQGDVQVWEVSFDGQAGFRQELVDVRGTDAVFPIGSFVVSDGREIGRLDGLSVAADGNPLFRIERATYPLAAPLSWDLSWGPYCDEPEGDVVTTCSDWRGTELQIRRHADSGLVTYLRGHLAELGLIDPFSNRANRSVALGEGSGEAAGPGDPVAEMSVVDVVWDPVFDEDTFVVSAPDGTTSLREDGFDDEEPGWNDRTGPPTMAFSFTVTQIPAVEGDAEALGPATWRFEHDPERGWRAEAIANGDERWEPAVGSLEVSDGERLWHYEARTARYEELATSRPRTDALQQVLVAYLDDVVSLEPVGGDLGSFLAGDACESAGDEPVAGVPTSIYDCEVDGVTDRLWVHEETSLVLRRGRGVSGGDVTIWHEVSQFELDPDLSGLDVTFTPPPGSVSVSATELVAELAEGEVAPVWRAPSAAGGELSSTDLEGQVTVMLFQAEGCPISALQCRAFDRLLDLAERRDDTVTVWVSRREFPGTIEAIVEARGFAGHVLADDGTSGDGPSRAWGVAGRVWDPRIPTVLWVVLDGDGRVVLISDADATLGDLEAAVDRAGLR